MKKSEQILAITQLDNSRGLRLLILARLAGTTTSLFPNERVSILSKLTINNNMDFPFCFVVFPLRFTSVIACNTEIQLLDQQNVPILLHV